MTGQPYHPDIKGKIFAPELGPKAKVSGSFQHFLLQIRIPERMAGFTALGGQGIQIPGRSQFQPL